MVKQNFFNRNRQVGSINSVTQHDLANLSADLQQELRQQWVSPPPLQIRCANRDEGLVVLAEHLLHIEPQPRETFIKLEQEIRQIVPKLLRLSGQFTASQLPAELRVQLFLRIAGYQQPYASHQFQLDLRRSAAPEVVPAPVQSAQLAAEFLPVPTEPARPAVVEPLIAAPAPAEPIAPIQSVPSQPLIEPIAPAVEAEPVAELIKPIATDAPVADAPAAEISDPIAEVPTADRTPEVDSPELEASALLPAIAPLIAPENPAIEVSEQVEATVEPVPEVAPVLEAEPIPEAVIDEPVLEAEPTPEVFTDETVLESAALEATPDAPALEFAPGPEIADSTAVEPEPELQTPPIEIPEEPIEQIEPPSFPEAELITEAEPAIEVAPEAPAPEPLTFEDLFSDEPVAETSPADVAVESGSEQAELAIEDHEPAVELPESPAIEPVPFIEPIASALDSEPVEGEPAAIEVQPIASFITSDLVEPVIDKPTEVEPIEPVAIEAIEPAINELVEPTVVDEPIEAIEPASIESIGPIESFESVEFVESIEPIESIETVAPTVDEPIASIELPAVELVEPTIIDEAVESIEPTAIESVEPSALEFVAPTIIESVEPSIIDETIETIEPIESIESVEPTVNEPIESVEPVAIEPIELPEPVELPESVGFVESAVIDESVESVESVELPAFESAESTVGESVEPTESVEFVEPAITELADWDEPVVSESIESTAIESVETVETVETVESPTVEFVEPIESSVESVEPIEFVESPILESIAPTVIDEPIAAIEPEAIASIESSELSAVEFAESTVTESVEPIESIEPAVIESVEPTEPVELLEPTTLDEPVEPAVIESIESVEPTTQEFVESVEPVEIEPTELVEAPSIESIELAVIEPVTETQAIAEIEAREEEPSPSPAIEPPFLPEAMPDPWGEDRVALSQDVAEPYGLDAVDPQLDSEELLTESLLPEDSVETDSLETLDDLPDEQTIWAESSGLPDDSPEIDSIDTIDSFSESQAASTDSTDAITILDEDIPAAQLEEQVAAVPGLVAQTERSQGLDDPDIAQPELAETKPRRSFRWSASSITLVTAIGSFIAVGGGYLLTRPCVIGSCEPLQAAQQLSQEAIRTVRTTDSAREVIDAYKKLNEANYLLGTIPNWSPYRREAESLLKNYEGQTVALGKIVGALEKADQASKKSQNPPHPVQEWREIQWLWREAITQLQAIPSNDPMYGLVQRKLEEYQKNLAGINQRVAIEQQAQDRITAARQIEQLGTARASAAKSPANWQETASTWTTAIEQLRQIPQGTMAYDEAQQLLAIYQPKLAEANLKRNQEQTAVDVYAQALDSAKQAQVMEQQNQWIQAATYWQDALVYIQQVPSGSNYYNQVQTLGDSYRQSLQRAQQNSQRSIALQAVKPSLEKACSGSPRLCTYTLSPETIRVQFTGLYDKTVETLITKTEPATGANSIPPAIVDQVNGLLRSLADVGDATQVPIELYDSRGTKLGIYTPSLSGYVAQ